MIVGERCFVGGGKGGHMSGVGNREGWVAKKETGS
jgi:hypothetical protein